MDFPAARFHRPVISTMGPESVGAGMVAANGQSAPASGTWPAVNRAILVPLIISAPYLVNRFFWLNGLAIAGNVDCGIYSANSNGGALLANTTSTAQSGTSLIQTVDVTDFLLMPGSYYLALAMSSTTAAVMRFASGSVPTFVSLGVANATASVPLPASLTPVQALTAAIPVCGIATAAVI